MSDPFYHDWSQALRSGDAEGLAPYFSDERARQRFAVYRNNVVSAAIEALPARASHVWISPGGRVSAAPPV